MRKWFQNLKIAQKLMLISIFFVLPDSVMLYLFITAINDNIDVARLEQKGNQYQRPLEELLEAFPQHQQAAQQMLEGDAAAQPRVARIAAQIDASFRSLEAVNARIGEELQFTDEGLAKRHREHYRVSTVRAEWEELKGEVSHLTPAVSAEKHLHLVADIRTMITHAGDTSNLILDPDLDSYYLMDATLLALPAAQDRLAVVMTSGQAVLGQPYVTDQERQDFAVFVTLLQQEDLEHVTTSVETSLREDPNFYGTSPSLQERVPPILAEYSVAIKEFIVLTKRFVDAQAVGITADAYLAAGTRAREASFKLWRIADEEVDTLLERRIESYQHRRLRSLLVAGCALLAAVGFVTFITRSISGPLRQQAAALQTVNQTLQAEIAERQRVETALRTAEEQYRSIFENAVEGIFQTTLDGRYLVANPTLARIYGYDSVADLQASVTDIGARLYVNANRRAEFQRLIERDGEVHAFDSQIYRKDESVMWISEHARAVRDAAGQVLYYEGTVEDITERKRNEQELELLNKQLMDTSRRAGMAEVATGVLHNVGNVLNSVNVSAMFIADRLAKSRVAHLTNVAAVLRENAADLGQFLTTDPKGKKLPDFITSLAERLSVEQAELMGEVESLAKNIAHIKEIVTVQQTYAKVSGIIEVLPATDLVEDALEMNGAAFHRHGVEVVREFAAVPPVLVDRHKVLQVLINVIRNAKYAVSECSRRDKRIVVRIGANGDRRVKIAVADNGIGIAPENLARIFAHGFTTKKDGHGFGLHSAALAATEMGGSLFAHSDGPGHGATFTLELPMAEEANATPQSAALAS